MAKGGLLGRVRSTVGALILLVGLPIALVRLVGWPLPTRWPDRQQWVQWLEEPLTDGTLIGAAVVVAWLLWGVLVYAALAEIVLRLRRAVRWLRRLPRLPMPTPMQGLAGGMLGAVAFTTTTGTASAPPAAPVMSTLGAGTAAEQEAAATAGVELPDGGWLPTPLARAVDAAAVLVWWRRRQRYQPGPPTNPEQPDADLATLPAAVSATQAALQDGRHHPSPRSCAPGCCLSMSPAASCRQPVCRRCHACGACS